MPVLGLSSENIGLGTVRIEDERRPAAKRPGTDAEMAVCTQVFPDYHRVLSLADRAGRKFRMHHSSRYVAAGKK